MSPVLRAHLALFLTALIYGANYSIAKIAMANDQVPPLAFILLRGVTATTLFWLLQRYLVRERIERRDIGLLILCAVTGVAINQMFFFSGLKLTTPINASLMMTTTPILVLVISAAMLGEPVTGRKLLGIVLGAGGAILLISYGQEVRFNRSGLLGDIMIFINAAAYAVYLVMGKSLMLKYHPLTVVTWVFSFGLIFVIPFGVSDLQRIQWHLFTPAVWASVVYVLLLTTFLAYLLNALALRDVNPSVASIYIYLQPLLAALIALVMGSDSLTPVKLLSGCMIFSGVYLVSRS